MFIVDRVPNKSIVLSRVTPDAQLSHLITLVLCTKGERGKAGFVWEPLPQNHMKDRSLFSRNLPNITQKHSQLCSTVFLQRTLDFKTQRVPAISRKWTLTVFCLHYWYKNETLNEETPFVRAPKVWYSNAVVPKGGSRASREVLSCFTLSICHVPQLNQV